VAKRSRIDLSRIASTALYTAIDADSHRPRRLSGVRAVAAGAVVAAAVRLVATRAPTLSRIPDLSDLTDGVRQRLAEHGLIDDEDRRGKDEELEGEEDPEAEAGGEAGDEEGEDEEGEEEESGREAGEHRGDEQEDDEDESDEEEEPIDEADQGDDEDEPQDQADEDEDEEEEEASAPGVEIGARGGFSNRRGTRAPDLMQLLNEPPEPPVQNGETKRQKKTKTSKAKAGRS